jgi:hypothetical protein
MAGIPYVGPALAVAAAAAMMALVMGFASMISAAGGYDIPAGINPMVQTHAEEMVLPASLSNKIRNMTDGGGSVGGGGGGNTFVVQAWDSKDVSRFLRSNGHHIANALKGPARSYQLNTLARKFGRR